MIGDGRLLALNSYENRVYQVWLDEAPPVVAKFYRPAALDRRADPRGARLRRRTRRARDPGGRRRWPIGGATLHHRRLPLRRLSAPRRPRAGTRRSGDAGVDGPLHRPHPRRRRARSPSRIGPRSTSRASATSRATCLLEHDFIPPDLRRRLDAACRRMALDGVRRAFDRAGDVARCACTATATPATCCGREDGPHFVDFDDARMGPAVQDLWMLLSGDRAAMTRQLSDSARRLRGLRRLRPPRAAPGRGAAHAAPPPLLGVDRAPLGRPGVSGRVSVVRHQRYWQDRILELREQIAAMDEPPLVV